jgi:hypothetical protein
LLVVALVEWVQAVAVAVLVGILTGLLLQS